MSDKAQSVHSKAQQNAHFAYSPKTTSIPGKIIAIFQKHPGKEYCTKGLIDLTGGKKNTVYSALRRLFDHNRIYRRREDGNYFYSLPGGSLDLYYKLWDVTKGLPGCRFHNIVLFYTMSKHKHAIYGVEHFLGSRKGTREWKYAKVSRDVNWIIGFNKGKSKPPSIQISLPCTKRPIDLDGWIAFMLFLDGMLPGIHLLDEPEGWRIKRIEINWDNKYLPGVVLENVGEIRPFTDAIFKIYNKEIDGNIFQRNEIKYLGNKERPLEFIDWFARIQGSTQPHQAEAEMVVSLNHIRRESTETRQSMARMEKEFSKGMTDVASAVETLAAAILNMQAPPPRKKKRDSNEEESAATSIIMQQPPGGT